MDIPSLTLINKNNVTKHLADYGVYIGSQNSGLNSGLRSTTFLPESNTSLLTVPRKDGAYFFYKNLEPRKISYEMFFQEKTEAELNEIKRIFYCAEPHKLIDDFFPYKFIWVISDNSEVSLDYVWDGFVYSGFIKVDYLAYDPKYYSVFTAGDLLGYLEDHPTYPILYYDSGLPYLEDVPDVSFANVTSNGTVNIYNGGNYKAVPTLKLVGSGTNISITNVTNGENCMISSMASETIYIDGVRGQVRNATVLKTNLFSGSFIALEPGDNTITIVANSINLSQLVFDYRYTYI